MHHSGKKLSEIRNQLSMAVFEFRKAVDQTKNVQILLAATRSIIEFPWTGPVV